MLSTLEVKLLSGNNEEEVEDEEDKEEGREEGRGGG